MEHYIVYWPQDIVNNLKRAGDEGPIKVVYGSIHSRMPTISSVKEGDIVYPVTLIKKQLYVMARLPVEHKETAFDYLMRELGQDHGALLPDGVAVEHSSTFYWTIGKGYNSREAVPEGIRIITLDEQKEKPHQEHQVPFNCCSKHAAWGTKGSSIRPRLIPAELVPTMLFGPKGKERPLTMKNGVILSNSLTATRRMTEETAEIFEKIFALEQE